MEDKVLCCCHNVTVKDLEDRIKEGVTTFEKLQDLTKIGTSCPPCEEEAKKIFIELTR